MIKIDLSAMTALVTGASQGLGRSTAELLHAAGANVVINYFDDSKGVNQERAEQVVDSLGVRAVALEADVRKMSGVETMIDQIVEQFGHINIVVNNAGILQDRTVVKMSQDQWQQVIDTNLTGVFNVCKAVSERLSDQGRIVNLASISGVIGFFGQANYAAAKAGVVAMTKVLSKELAWRQITVNAIAPGVVLTDMGKSIPGKIRQQMLNHIPLGRFGQSEDVARVILFLCSDLASYVTGQTIHVNGGWWG